MATLTKKDLFEDSEDIWLNEFRIELFNALAQKGFNVYKAREVGTDRFIVMAELPTGQISKHYEMKEWDKFQIPEKEFADKQNEYSPRNITKLTVLQRIRRLIRRLIR